MKIEKEKMNDQLDGSRKLTELDDDELTDVSGGSSDGSSDSDLLYRYIYFPGRNESGQIIKIYRQNVGYSYATKYVVRLNKGGEITIGTSAIYELLPEGVVDKQTSEDGEAVSVTF